MARTSLLGTALQIGLTLTAALPAARDPPRMHVRPARRGGAAAMGETGNNKRIGIASSRRSSQ
ncbi:MAG TPA: hypothetical protein VIY55_13930 [Acetobacteraceae bacterium]